MPPGVRGRAMAIICPPLCPLEHLSVSIPKTEATNQKCESVRLRKEGTPLVSSLHVLYSLESALCRNPVASTAGRASIVIGPADSGDVIRRKESFMNSNAKSSSEDCKTASVGDFALPELSISAELNLS